MIITSNIMGYTGKNLAISRRSSVATCKIEITSLPVFSLLFHVEMERLTVLSTIKSPPIRSSIAGRPDRQRGQVLYYGSGVIVGRV